MRIVNWFARETDRLWLAFVTASFLWAVAFSSLLNPFHFVSGILMTLTAGLGSVFYVVWIEALEARAGRRFDGG